MKLTDRFRPVAGPARERPESPFQAFDRVLRRPCMVKFASVRSAGVADLRTEGRSLSQLSHPNLVDLIATFDDAPVPWGGERVAGIATGWVDGDPFVDGLRGAPPSERLSAYLQLLDVVAYLHRAGILHLDLKPANALWTGERVVLLDLGSARPLDVGPGQAGGTLGYASPEVLVGQAASVGSDVYSLGVILYQLLVDRLPHGHLDGQELRRATLAGEVVNPRFVDRSVSRERAELLMDMLAREPARRPGSLAEVMERLAPDHAVAGLGRPPFVGRTKEAARLQELLSSEEGARIDVVGAPGSGRSRLVRQVLDLGGLAARLDCLDLGDEEEPLLALDAHLRCAGLSLPDLEQGSAWLGKAAAGLRKTKALRVLFLGRRERRRPDTLRVLDSLCEALVEVGGKAVWATTEAGEGARDLAVAPLTLEASSRLALFYGVSRASTVRELRSRTGAWPQALITQLDAREASGTRAPGDGVDGVIAALPLGIGPGARGLLPLPLQRRLDLLEESGRASLAADGRLYVEGEGSPATPDGALVDELVQVIEGLPQDREPVFFALTAARLGRTELAAARFGACTAAERRGDYMELCERLVVHGLREAKAALARLRMEEGALDEAEQLLESLAPRSPEEELVLVVVLSLAGRRDEALERCDALLQQAPSVEAWSRRANLLVELDRLEEAEEACERGAREAGDPDHPAVIKARIRVALGRLDARGQPRELEDLLRRIGAARAAGRLDSTTLSAAGRLHTRIGRVKEGAEILDEAAQAADDANQRVAAAGIRINAGSAWQRLGRGNEARKRYKRALGIAEEIHHGQLELRLHYSLAELELRSGRLPDAERHIRAFEELSRTVSLPGAEARYADLRARWLLAKGRPKAALDVIEGVHERLPADLEASLGVRKAMALLELERPEEALPVLESLPRTSNDALTALASSLEGRAHIALGRERLTRARLLVPDEVDPMVTEEFGSVLLSWAGEDLDPNTFHLRRLDLNRAASMLRDEQAARAATLRDRMLDGPGAALEGIVKLTETMHDAKAFPEAMARLVSEALGAYRVLIMVRIPGLGQQVSYTELSGAEAAGISVEVLRRITDPDDYWLAHNAFADPRLRESSQTVKTFKLKSLLAVAIPHGDRAVGALYVDDLHRANRFGDDDIAILRRLAVAIGKALPLLSASSREPLLEEPVDMYGVLMSRQQHIDDMDYALSMIEGQEQTNLLITGPTGAGKTVLAERLATEVLELEGIVRVVMRRGDPDKLVSALSGTRRGEFTSAVDRKGAIDRCLKEGKALFLDEVQNLDEAGQEILLPFLELPDRHVGGLTGPSERLTRPLHVILGTNVDVERGGWEDYFREDLWYRMSHVRLHLPSLAERGPEAVYRYLGDMLAKRGLGLPEQVFHTAALHRLTHWSWPGNFRRLESFAEHAAHLHRTQERRLGIDDLVRLQIVDEGVSETGSGATASLEDAKVQHVMTVLARHDWVQKAAAAELEMTTPTLSRFLRRHGLSKQVAENRRNRRKAAGSK